MRIIGTSAAAFVVGVLMALHVPVPLRAATAIWTSSDLDTWIYNKASAPGQRVQAPTWLNDVTVNSSTQQFNPMTSTDPARLGESLFAFNSSGKITPGLTPARYQINSVTFVASCHIVGAQTAYYESLPVSQTQVLSEFATNSVTWQKPMELYGVGFRGGYTGFEFSAGTFGPPLFEELVYGYSGAGGSYVVYPVVGSNLQAGAFVDVSNSVTGGFSATDSGNTTAPFTPIPWAIGTTTLSRGDPLPADSTFTFAVDLDGTGVRSYLQQSLANGGVGFVVSSLHSTTANYNDVGVYPQWYTKEALDDGVPAALLPQLLIDYTILPAGVPGDYNDNGSVDAADYVLWRNGGPLQNEVEDIGSVTVQDYTVWRTRFGNIAAASASLGGSAMIPEPATIMVSSIWIAGMIGAARSRRV